MICSKAVNDHCFSQLHVFKGHDSSRVYPIVADLHYDLNFAGDILVSLCQSSTNM
jgi:hypothetical protein